MGLVLSNLRKLVAFAKLMRWPLASLGILASFSVVSLCGQLGTHHAQLAILVASIINVSFNIFNEIKDVETDKINKKDRKPLAKGEIRVEDAEALFSVLMMFSLILIFNYSIYVMNLLATAIALLGMVFSYLYDMYGKRNGVLGNIILMMPYTLAILFLLQDCGMVEKYWLFSLGFGTTTFAFNCLTLWQDMESDRDAGLYTAPMQLGRYTFHVTVMTALVSSILYFVTALPLASKCFFIITNVFVLLGSSSILLNKPVLVEYFCRVSGRILLIISFVFLLFKI